MNRFLRLLAIIRTVIRYRLDSFIPRENLRWPLKLAVALAALFPANSEQRAVRLRHALQDLGPVFIKFGQLLSTRRDLLPTDLADELAKLQDQVAPFDSATSVAIIENALHQSVEQAFARFEVTPLASASVAQIHSARLHSGEEVVVKVIRPGIERVIHQDIQLLFLIATLIEKYSLDGRRLRPVEVVSDYRHTIFDELDLKREAANCSQLKRNFEASEELQKMLIIPKIFWDFSCQKVLVMERMYGVPVSNIDELNENNVNLKVLAERGVEIFFTQVFDHNFFHADMHPGNIFVDISKPDSPRYIGIDCAIMGSLSDSDRYYLARNLLAVFNRDYHLVAQLHIESGWVPAETNAQAFENLIRSACEPIFERPISEISFGTLLIYLFQAARRFGMEVQPSLVLLQKTLLNIEGLGRQLYPDLDLWQTAHPFLENWMAKRYSPQRILSELKDQAPSLLELLPSLPHLVFDKLRQDTGPSSKQQQQLRRHEQQQIDRLERLARQQQLFNVTLGTFAILFIISTLFFN